MKPIKGFKGFDKDMKCRGKQYAEDTVFEETGQISLCNHGIHYCENPLDVLDFYNLCDSEFAEIEDLGTPKKDDKKSCTNKIKIKGKLGLSGFVNASIEFVFKKCFPEKEIASSGDYAQQASSGDNAKQASSGYSAQQASSGDNAKQASSGDYAQQASSGDNAKQASSGDNAKQASSGDYAQQASSGYNAKHILTGKDSIAAAIGKYSQIKGRKGTWIILAEYNNDNSVKCVKSAKIDGKKLKADTFYKLVDNKIVPA